MSDIDLQVALMEAGRMNLMHLPPGAISWLWDRPTKQIDAAESLAVAANAHGNPVVDASLLKADQNILLIKCEGGECFRIYPDGGFSHEDTPMDIGGCSSILQGQESGECPMDDNGHQMPPEEMGDIMSDGPITLDAIGAALGEPDMLMGEDDGNGDPNQDTEGETKYRGVEIPGKFRSRYDKIPIDADPETHELTDEDDGGGKQTYWLYLHGNHVASVRLPAGASERDVKMAAMDQLDRAPGVSHLTPEHTPATVRSMIHHSEVRMHEDMGNDEHMDSEPPKPGVASPQRMSNLAGEPTMDEDQGGDVGGPGASTMGGMGTGSPYVGDTDMYNKATMGQSMDASEELDNQMMSRELGEASIHMFRNADDDMLDDLMEAMGLAELDESFD